MLPMRGKQRRMVEGLEGFIDPSPHCALPLGIHGGVTVVDREARQTSSSILAVEYTSGAFPL
jgi:hypothetical protein